MSTVYLLGPCHKVDRTTGELHPAFGGASRSGRFLRNILHTCPRRGVAIVFDNIMPSAHFDAAGRETIPDIDELTQTLQDHRLWRDADVVVGFGASVKAALEHVAAMTPTQTEHACATRLVYLPHPSYVLRRPAAERRAFAEQLISALGDLRFLRVTSNERT